jgi:hypothetical protein
LYRDRKTMQLKCHHKLRIHTSILMFSRRSNLMLN